MLMVIISFLDYDFRIDFIVWYPRPGNFTCLIPWPQLTLIFTGFPHFQCYILNWASFEAVGCGVCKLYDGFYVSHRGVYQTHMCGGAPYKPGFILDGITLILERLRAVDRDECILLCLLTLSEVSEICLRDGVFFLRLLPYNTARIPALPCPLQKSGQQLDLRALIISTRKISLHGSTS